MPNKKSPLYNYRSPRDYKVFNMGNEASPPFKMKYNNSAFPFKESPTKRLDDPSVGDQSYAMENGDSEKKKKGGFGKGAIAAIPGALSSLGATITNATRVR